MKKCIVIPTYNQEKRSKILRECLNSIETEIPIIIVVNGGGSDVWGYKTLFNKDNSQTIGALHRAYLETNCDEYFLMHDTCQIKDNSLWDIVFNQYKGKSISISPGFKTLIGKYRREILDKIVFPKVKTKREGHLLGEVGFTHRYLLLDPPITLCPEFKDDKNKTEFKWGRLNLKLDCKYMTKWKGNWTQEMLKGGGVQSINE